jgi:hypothetical protein
MSSIEPNRPPAPVFWGEIAPSDHIAHFYDDEQSFLVTLSGFIAEGLAKGEGTIVIATPDHLSALEKSLLESGIDLATAIAEDRYIPMDAETTIARFMRNKWPDDHLFANLVGELIARASKNGRSVRAFGEMVALLWARGLNGSTVRLEHLWNTFCRNYGFSLLCSYPKAGFTKDRRQSIAEICTHHSRHLGDDRTAEQPVRKLA